MIEVITLENIEKWDEIVRSFENYDVYYLSGYVRGFQLHGDGEPLLFYYNGGTTRAMTVMMKRDIAKDNNFSELIEPNQYFDIVSPYGYGGFIFEGDDSEVAVKECYDKYIEKLKQENIIAAFVRYHPVLNNAPKLKSASTIIDLGKTIAIELTDEETIWKNFTSKNRNTTRRAIKNNVTIKHDNNKDLFEEFIKIYNQTMDNDNATDYYYFTKEFYHTIADYLKDNYQLFYAELDDKIIAMSIILFANNQMHYHLSGGLMEYRDVAPTNLLLFEAAKWGSEQGYKTFHLGGGLGSGEDNLYKFKAAFNRESDYQFSIGKDIIDQEKYNELVNYRAKEDDAFDKDSNFFPLYRA